MRLRFVTILVATCVYAAAVSTQQNNPAIAQVLIDAVARGAEEEVRALLRGGVNPNATDVCGHTALMTAAGSVNSTIVKILLDAGSDVNVVERVSDEPKCMGSTALIEASLFGEPGQADVVAMLLDREAIVNRRNVNGWNAVEGLHASRSGIVNQFIDYSDMLPADSPLESRIRARANSEAVADSALPVVNSYGALLALMRLTTFSESDLPQRQRIRASALGLVRRWPSPSSGAYGISSVVVSTQGPTGPRVQRIDLAQYSASLVRDIVMMEQANRNTSSEELIRIVADDIEAKLQDCVAAGNGAAGTDLHITFTAIQPPNIEVKGRFRLRFKDAQTYGLERAKADLGPKADVWQVSPGLGTSEVSMAPGHYLMYVSDESANASTECEWFNVGRHGALQLTFNVAGATPRRCAK
jgi:hypothetical protein